MKRTCPAARASRGRARPLRGPPLAARRGPVDCRERGTNRSRDKRIYPERGGPIGAGTRGYTQREGDQSEQGQEDIPRAGTNRTCSACAMVFT
eukprot:1192002-Prorocentrum_minimum.AAC.2